MAKLLIKSGKGQLVLTKSRKYIGLKTVDQNVTDLPIKAERYKHLGGFSVVTLNDTATTPLNTQLDALRDMDEVSVGTHIYHTPGSERPIVPNGNIAVIFETPMSAKKTTALFAKYALDVVDAREDNTYILKVTAASPNPIKVAMALQKLKNVRLAEPDFDTTLDNYAYMTPKDGLLPHAWHLQNNGSIPDSNWMVKKGADSKIVEAWKRLDGFGANTITIAVIDNGFDTSHPDLSGKIYRPFDLWNQTANLLQGDSRFTHGTPCASVALGASNGVGMVGAAPNARFMPLSGTSFELSATEQMYNYCIQNGADIISCSWGTTEQQFGLNALKEAAITKAARQGRGGKGCVICYAAGNENLEYVNYYSTHPDVICVAASTSQDVHAEYSNRGSQVWVCAPSNGDWPITAARAWWDQGDDGQVGEFRYWMDGKSRGNQYKHFGGTSSATPLVAGICALMLSANPNLSAAEVKDVLKVTADKIGNPNDYYNGRSVRYGWGRVNADKAVAEAIRRKSGSAVSPTPPTPNNPFKASQTAYPASGFGIQVGSYSDAMNARAQADAMEATWKRPTFIYMSVDAASKKMIYRIVVGAFATSAEASALLLQLKNKGVVGILKDLKTLK
jgi:subtilisin family serine protease